MYLVRMGLAIALVHGANALAEPGVRPVTPDRARPVLAALERGACRSAASAPADVRGILEGACDPAGRATPRGRREGATVHASTLLDGLIVRRVKLVRARGIAVDLVAYASSGLVVGGILCFPDDGAPHPTVIHIHGGTGGLFDDSSGEMVSTCINWARRHRFTAFAPSLRGQDGGEGALEVCLGEATDVVSAALMLRSLRVVDGSRLGVVGGSIGGCIALKAGSLIPDLRAVVAFVPPTDWKGFVDFHRSRDYADAVETLCDGSPRAWDFGGAEMADTFDRLICGHPFCPLADYEARSPIPSVVGQSAPTLIVSAGADNIVPVEQQVLWSQLRQGLGHSVDHYVVDPCDPPGTPALTQDVHVHVQDAFHLLSPGSISSGFLFLMGHLEAPRSREGLPGHE